MLSLDLQLLQVAFSNERGFRTPFASGLSGHHMVPRSSLLNFARLIRSNQLSDISRLLLLFRLCLGDVSVKVSNLADGCRFLRCVLLLRLLDQRLNRLLLPDMLAKNIDSFLWFALLAFISEIHY